MTGEVNEILTLRSKLKSDWLFPSDSPLNPGGHIITLQRAHDDVMEVLIGKDPDFPRFTICDFRHTFATRMATGEGGREPMPLPILAAILGHGSMSTPNKYVHLNQNHMDEATEVVERHSWVKTG
jgi:integrase